MKAINLSWVLIACLIAGQASASSIGFRSISSYMDWEPDCFEPSEPFFFVSDLDDFNRAVDEFNNYVRGVEAYLGCIQAEAETDLRTLSRAISNSLDEKSSAIVSKVDLKRSNLELERILLP